MAAKFDVERFTKSEHGSTNMQNKDIKKVIRCLSRYDDRTVEHCKRLNAILGRQGTQDLAALMRRFVTPGVRMELKRPFNSDNTARMAAKVEEEATTHGVDVNPFSVDLVPGIFNKAMGMSQEAFVLAWSLAGCPGHDGEPITALLGQDSEMASDPSGGQSKAKPAPASKNQPALADAAQEQEDSEEVSIDLDDAPKEAKRSSSSILDPRGWFTTSAKKQKTDAPAAPKTESGAQTRVVTEKPVPRADSPAPSVTSMMSQSAHVPIGLSLYYSGAKETVSRMLLHGWRLLALAASAGAGEESSKVHPYEYRVLGLNHTSPCIPVLTCTGAGDSVFQNCPQFWVELLDRGNGTPDRWHGQAPASCLSAIVFSGPFCHQPNVEPLEGGSVPRSHRPDHKPCCPFLASGESSATPNETSVLRSPLGRAHSEEESQKAPACTRRLPSSVGPNRYLGKPYTQEPPTHTPVPPTPGRCGRRTDHPP